MESCFFFCGYNKWPKFDLKKLIPRKLNLWYIFSVRFHDRNSSTVPFFSLLAVINGGSYMGPLYINGPKINGFPWGYFTWLTGGLYPWQWLKGGIWGGWFLRPKTRVFTFNGGFLVREMVPEIFQGNLGWWNIISVGQKYDFWISNN